MDQTSPSSGNPPHDSMISEAANINKKCTSPCSSCDRCLFAMNNQYYWFQNWLDYINVRYFHIYIAYMVAGLAFVLIVGLDLWYHVLWINETSGLTHEHDTNHIVHSYGMGESGGFGPFLVTAEYDSEKLPQEHDLPKPVITEVHRITASLWKRKALVCIAIICFSVLFAFGILLITHGIHTSGDIHITTPRCNRIYNQIIWYSLPTTIERWP